MTKKDLQDGDLLITRCGYEYRFFKASGMMCRPDGYMPLTEYNNCLICLSGDDFDILKIKRSNYSNFLDPKTNIVFNRQEEIVMTIQEIKEKLGVSNLKIKK